ncbi:histidine kinase [Variovorax sp. RO1]|uniref:sensor histidine kinase n=1 Tax=Variovorax sp. RO1 TaxID=2066034 RepID=UPI000C716560|nr:sensor histidine kinase [Variovorax sp. RO1]PLC05484.1 histidine kinase [Variovorax sp. RO1]
MAGIVVALLLFLCMASRAEPPALRLDPELSFAERTFDGHLQVYHDASGMLSQSEVALPPYSQRFQPIQASFNGGYSHGAWWVRFPLQTTREQRADPIQGGWWLRLSAPYVDTMDVWLPGAGEALVHRELGDLRSSLLRDWPGTLPAVRLLNLVDDQPRWVWVRLAGARALSLSGGVSSVRELADVQQKITVASAGAIGMVLLLAFVSLVVGVAVPDRRFIAYAGYLSTLALLFASSQDLPASLGLLDSPAAAVRLHSFSVCLHTAAAFAFARSLLDMAHQFPRMDRVFQALSVVCALACIVALAGGFRHIALPLSVLWVLMSICVVSQCAVLLRRNVEAWPSLIGYAVYLALGVQHFAKNLQWLPYALTTQYSYAIGAIIHILAFFFTLGWRVRNRERRALALSLRHGERLEQRVNVRTEDLRQEIAQHHLTHNQLTMALREQQGMLAMVSHEFRTPLGTIGGAAQILSDERLGLARDDVKREAEKITRTVSRMRDLMDTLLADQWLEASSESMSRRDIDLAELLREKIDEHNEGSAHGRIRLSLEASHPTVLADETLLHIALDNLLTNALKYAPATSPVEVRACVLEGGVTGGTAGACVAVQVLDQGPGFRPPDLPHVFDRFYRAEGARRIPGIGLGLHMVQRIALLHGGSVAAANRAEGGAVVTLTLPCPTAGDVADGRLAEEVTSQ